MSFVLTTALVVAGSASAQNVMIRTDMCSGYDVNRKGYFIEGRSVLLKTRSGAEVYQCTGWMPPEAPLPDRILTFDYDNTNGTMCDLWLFDGRFESTKHWHIKISPSGHVTQMCRPSGR